MSKEISKDTKKSTNIVIAIVVIAVIVAAIIGVTIAVVMNNNKETTFTDGAFTIVKIGSTVKLTKFDGTAQDMEVKIPSKVGDYTIDTIATGTFKGKDNIKSVTIPSSIKTIEESAFENATSLSRVTMADDSVETIGKSAFKDCKALNHFNIPTSLKSIGEGAFENTTSLGNFAYNYKDNYTISSSLERIGKEAFKNSYLRTFVVPSSMKVVSSLAFYNAKLSDIIFFEGVEEISDSAFMNAFNYSGGVYTFSSETQGHIDTDLSENAYIDALKGVSVRHKLPDSLKVIGNNAFRTMKDKENASVGKVYLGNFTVPKNVESIGDYAFSGADIYELKFDSGITKLGKYAFSNLVNNLYISLPTMLEVVPEGLFFGTSISGGSVNIPESVKEIGVGAFAGPKGSNAPAINFVQGSVADGKYKFLSDGVVKMLMSKDGKILYSVNLSSGTLGDRIIVPDTVEIIEKYAFANVGYSRGEESKKPIYIGANVKEIKDLAFYNVAMPDFFLEHTDDDSITIANDAFKSDGNTKLCVVRVRKGAPKLYASLKEQFKEMKNMVDFYQY